MEETMKDILTRAKALMEEKSEAKTETPATPEAGAEVKTETTPEKVETTPPADPKVETPEATKTEGEPKKEENNSFFDTLLKTETDKPASTPNPQEGDDLAKKIADLEAKLQEKDGILSKYEQNEYIKAIAKYSELENFDPKTYIKEVVGEDYSRVPYDELTRRDLQSRYGLDGDSLERAVSKKIEEFDMLEDWEKIMAHKDLASKFTTEKKSGSELIKEWEDALKQKPSPESQKEIQLKQQEMLNKMIEEDQKAIKSETSKYVGQKIFGYEISESDMKAVESDYEKHVGAFITETNEFDSTNFVKERTLTRLLPKIVEAAKEEGRKEALAGRVKTDLTNTVTPSSPPINNDDPITKFLEKQGINVRK